MCFTAAFGTPAVCWHSYLLHLEDLIVLLLGNRSLDSSFEDTEAAWAPTQPPGLPSLAAIPTHPLQLSLLSPQSQVLLLHKLPSTQTLQNTPSKQWCHHKEPVNGTKCFF